MSPPEPIAWIADPAPDPDLNGGVEVGVEVGGSGGAAGGGFDGGDVDGGVNGGVDNKSEIHSDVAIDVAGAPRLSRGRWGHPDQLTLPLSDRGLQLADGLFETVLMEDGQPRLLAEHLERWRQSAALLAMAPPPGSGSLKARISEAVERSGIREGALRLNWSRGSGSRGLDLPAAGTPQPLHRFWLQLSACQPGFSAITSIISRHERRNAYSLVSRCKTFAYGGQIQARREARSAGADEALLLNSDGELCCGSAANLLVRISGRWLTPPASSGCLPGVMRRRALETATAKEAHLGVDDLLDSEGALLINSLGCRPLSRCDGKELPAFEPTAAEALWRSLLEPKAAKILPGAH